LLRPKGCDPAENSAARFAAVSVQPSVPSNWIARAAAEKAPFAPTLMSPPIVPFNAWPEWSWTTVPLNSSCSGLRVVSTDANDVRT
jgi:hypothetical protein